MGVSELRSEAASSLFIVSMSIAFVFLCDDMYFVGRAGLTVFKLQTTENMLRE